MSIEPSGAEIAALAVQVAGADRIIVGTINAYQHRGQAALIDTLIDRGKVLIAIAPRMPYDVNTYPRVPTCLCTYSLQPLQCRPPLTCCGDRSLRKASCR